MDDSWLLFFDIVQCGNITAAAEKNGISVLQAAQQIADMENRLGFLLFDQYFKDGTFLLSKAGSSLYANILPIYRQYEKVICECSKIAVEHAKPFKIGIVEHCCSNSELPVEALISNSEAQLISQDMETIYDLLRHNRIDLACLCAQYGISNAYASLPALKSALVIHIPKTHPLAKKKNVRLSSLLKEKNICPSLLVRQILEKRKALYDQQEDDQEEAIILAESRQLEDRPGFIKIPVYENEQPFEIDWRFYWKPANSSAALYHFLQNLNSSYHQSQSGPGSL